VAARKVVGRRPTLAIVAEPTGLDLVTQHKGSIRWRIRVHGRACHSAFPEQGTNAIYPAGRVILALESLACDLLTRHADHPCGPPTLNLGTIRGGAGVNLVPDLTVLEVERRVLPGESPQEARAEVIARIAAACPAASVEHDEPFLESDGLVDATSDPKAAAWVERLTGAVRHQRQRVHDRRRAERGVRPRLDRPGAHRRRVDRSRRGRHRRRDPRGDRDGLMPACHAALRLVQHPLRHPGGVRAWQRRSRSRARSSTSTATR
jgi:hypothetical protein